MRKLFLIPVVLLLASAAYAAPDVNIFCAQVGDTNEVIVSYLASKDVNIPRAFGLNIKLSNAETIVSVTPLDPNYWVYPGSYISPGSNDPNGPVGDPCDSDDTLPGIDSNGVTIEMASLHSPTDPCVTNPNAPDLGNVLLKFTVSGDCGVAISGNAARGKVVFYDAKNEDDGKDVAYNGCSVVIPPPGCPTCKGDMDRNTYVWVDDYQALLDLLLADDNLFIEGPDFGDDPDYDPCGDMDDSGYIWTDDLQALLDSLLANDKFYYCPGYP
jgi:hypothetical protein